MQTESVIEFKGSSFTLPVIYLNSTEPKAIQSALQAKIQQAPNLLTKAAVVINVSLLDDNFDIMAISKAVRLTGINIIGFSGCNTIKKKRLTNTGFTILNEGKIPPRLATKLKPAWQPPLYLTTPLRSGQQVYAKDRDLVVYNLVNTGAEIIADGNIYIFNSLRGKAIAGASGRQDAKIFCTHIEAELVSIAGNYWISEQIPLKFYKNAVIISLSDNKLQFEELTKVINYK
ncbi:septum site-determining protein MinC [Candidatus Schmidhempelia bombi]|jgi:septum site-determining protein MinC|uniref:Probable septum site-determining protein MinC n=1 Tax=Candidatus Schmidhempelia bombi str. Bimp TaxID=1387197 RepID=A0AB94IDU1_9GAMM|nr:septum site-determining protein MinC [Candidatus Schmidhempelia bombi]TEA27633.1 septum site-determining protein MinC [Candidatus Schmidhempelia bombi str. Bimp]